jgi:hypothetical protein
LVWSLNIGRPWKGQSDKTIRVPVSVSTMDIKSGTMTTTFPSNFATRYSFWNSIVIEWWRNSLPSFSHAQKASTWDPSKDIAPRRNPPFTSLVTSVILPENRH